MEISLPALVGIALATMFFGYFFGLFEGRGQGYKKGKKEEALDRQATGAPSAVPPPAAMPDPGTPNLLEFGRDDKGRPLLRLDGAHVEVANVTSDQRKRLIELLVTLRPWVDPATSPATGAGDIPASTSRTASVADGPSPAAAPDSVHQRAPIPAVAPTAPQPAAPPASLSLVAQVDAILQDRLEGTPLAHRGIRLAEALHQGATVFVGTTTYDGVDKVPDPEIKAAIRAAIAEWEKRFTPG